MYQTFILLFYVILFCTILYLSLFTHTEYLSYFTKLNQTNININKYDDYNFDYNSKKIITIYLKNANIYNLDTIKFIDLLANAINITSQRIHILHIDKKHSKIIFIIKKVDNINESSITQAIKLLKLNMNDFNSTLMKRFYIGYMTIKHIYINDNDYESYHEWWNKLDPSLYLK
mgnify:FL=1